MSEELKVKALHMGPAECAVDLGVFLLLESIRYSLFSAFLHEIMINNIIGFLRFCILRFIPNIPDNLHLTPFYIIFR